MMNRTVLDVKVMSDEWKRCRGPPKKRKKKKAFATTPNRPKRRNKLHRRALLFTMRRIQYVFYLANRRLLFINNNSFKLCGCCTQPEIICDCNRASPVLGQVFFVVFIYQ